MALPLTIAVAHSRISSDPHENGAHIRTLMHQAHERGARLIHFPEGAASGYTKSQIKDWQAVDWDALREELQAIAELAAKLSMWVVVGANHQLSAPNRPHNSMYVISDQGTLVGRYDKRFCSYSEITDWYTPGFEPLVFEIEGIRFACALCIELSFAEIFTEYRRLGAYCLLLSSYSNDPMDEVKARGHAAVHNFWLSLARPTNPKPPGFSALYGPDGSVVAETASGTPSLITAVIDLSDKRWEVPIVFARNWREKSLAGDIYEQRRVSDSRSMAKRSF